MMSLVLLMSGAFAAQPAPVITSYECKVMIVAQDLLPTGSASTTFPRPYLSNGSHGGAPFEFVAGEHKVGILADSKWRGIIWQRAGKDVAQVLKAGTEPITGSEVIILSNPQDLNEQVQLTCTLIPGDFPNE